jgi:hypothetical protein
MQQLDITGSSVDEFIFAKLPVHLVNRILSFLKLKWIQEFKPATVNTFPKFFMRASLGVGEIFTIKTTAYHVNTPKNNQISIYCEDILPESLAYLRHIESTGWNNCKNMTWTYPELPNIEMNEGFAGKIINGSTLTRYSLINAFSIDFDQNALLTTKCDCNNVEIKRALQAYSSESFLPIKIKYNEYIDLICKIDGYSPLPYVRRAIVFSLVL